MSNQCPMRLSFSCLGVLYKVADSSLFNNFEQLYHCYTSLLADVLRPSDTRSTLWLFSMYLSFQELQSHTVFPYHPPQIRPFLSTSFHAVLSKGRPGLWLKMPGQIIQRLAGLVANTKSRGRRRNWFSAPGSLNGN